MKRLITALNNAGPIARAGFLAAAALAAAVGNGQAQVVQRIAAVVNDSVISGYDLDQRLGLVVATAGVQPTPENIERIRPQILRTLIDERLQIQEARDNNIDISDEEIDEAIERLGARNNMSREQIEDFLGRVNVNIETLRIQVLAELAWSELVQSRFGPRVSVTDSEIDTVLDRIVNQSEQASYLVSEVFLPVENPSEEAEARESAQELATQIRQGGDIRAIASQFSQAPTAATGGDAGWVLDGQLPDSLNQELRRMQVGQVSDPIRTVSGYYILQLRDRRLGGDEQDPMNAEITIEAISIPFQEDMPRPELAQISQRVQAALEKPVACGQVQSIGQSIHPDTGFQRLEDRPIRSFPEQVRGTFVQMPTNQWSQPTRTGSGLEIIVICERNYVERELPTREAIEEQLFSQELSMMSRRYLRDLRRSAVVEMR